MGSYQFADNIDIPVNGVFVLLLTVVITRFYGLADLFLRLGNKSPRGGT